MVRIIRRIFSLLTLLQVLKGSAALYTQLWEAFEHQKPEGGWNVHDRHDHTPEQIQWLLDHGCEWYKVCAEPGDLLLWDSVSTAPPCWLWLINREQSTTAQHQHRPTLELLPVSEDILISSAENDDSDVCYKPASMVTPKVKAKRLQAWNEKKETTHDPITFNANTRVPPESHPTHNHPKVYQLQEPVLTPLGRKLAGLDDW